MTECKIYHEINLTDKIKGVIINFLKLFCIVIGCHLLII